MAVATKNMHVTLTDRLHNVAP